MFNIASLIAIRIAISFFHYRNITSVSFKIKIATILTFLISAYLYIDYSAKIINNVIIDRQFRNQISKKIIHSKLLEGTIGNNLTFKEYQQISKMYWFPTLPKEASNIQYSFSCEGFLNDYLFELTYDLPIETKVEAIDYNKSGFSKFQSSEIIDNKRRVTYSESQQ